MAADVLEFTVYGLPQPAGSKRAFPTKGGRIIVTDDNKRARPWKQEVASAAQTAMLAESVTENGTLVVGPLSLALVFVLPRPKGHFGKSGVRPSAPPYPIVRPDVLKLARAVEDACTGIVWRDDSQIVVESIQKTYGEPAHVQVFVGRVE